MCVCVLTAGWSWEKLLWRSPELRRCCCRRLPPPDLHTHRKSIGHFKSVSTLSRMNLKTLFICDNDVDPHQCFQVIFIINLCPHYNRNISASSKLYITANIWQEVGQTAHPHWLNLLLSLFTFTDFLFLLSENRIFDIIAHISYLLIRKTVLTC